MNELLPSQRTAVITGAGSERGIGRALALRLAEDGWAIAVLDIDRAGAERVSSEIALKYSVPTIGLFADVTDEQSVDSLLTRIEADLPPIVGLANVAGVSSPIAFLDVTNAEWDRVFDVNMKGPFFMTRRALPGMIERRLGRIVNVSSVSAQRGGGTYSKVPYSASKAAILGFTRALAREVGPFGVTVNAVSPGPIDTDIMGGTLTPERRAAMAQDLVVGRIGSVDDVAAVMAFLMSGDAGFVTGATYNVNGGLIID